MSTTGSFCPDWVSAPGETITDMLNERRISVEDFAQQIGQSAEEAAELLRGRMAITLGLARRLEKILGGSVQFWMSRDFQYRGRMAGAQTESAWLRQFPIPDMVKFGWIRRAPGTTEQVAACLSFFGVPNIHAWHRAYKTLERRFAFRTSPLFQSEPGAVAAWLRQGEIEAGAIACAPWNKIVFKDVLTSIRTLSREKEPEQFVPRLRHLCAGAGVAVAIVRPPSGCRASGATRFVTENKALLLLSFRYLSDDQFWFSFFHEAGHLLLHGSQELFIEGEEMPASHAETEANEFAYHILIPQQFESDFLSLRANKYELVRFARKIGISPGIVAGQLQHQGKIRPNHFNGLKRRYKWE